MTSCPVAGQFTNTCSPFSLDLASRYKEAETWPQKTLPKLRRLFSLLTSPAHWLGLSCCACLAINMPWKCSYLLAQRPTAWVKRLPDVIEALNNEAARLTSKQNLLSQSKRRELRQNLPLHSQGLFGVNEKNSLPTWMFVFSTSLANSVEGGTKRPAAPIWSLKVYTLQSSVTTPNEPVVCYFAQWLEVGLCEELLVIPPNTQLPPAYVTGTSIGSVWILSGSTQGVS